MSSLMQLQQDDISTVNFNLCGAMLLLSYRFCTVAGYPVTWTGAAGSSAFDPCICSLWTMWRSSTTTNYLVATNKHIARQNDHGGGHCSRLGRPDAPTFRKQRRQQISRMLCSAQRSVLKDAKKARINRRKLLLHTGPIRNSSRYYFYLNNLLTPRRLKRPMGGKIGFGSYL